MNLPTFAVPPAVFPLAEWQSNCCRIVGPHSTFSESRFDIGHSEGFLPCRFQDSIEVISVE